jgi:hypothetical protein
MMANSTGRTAYIQGSTEAVFLVCFTSIQCVVGSIANAVVIGFFLLKRNRSHKPSDKLILNLALADFVALTTYVPWRAYLLHLRKKTKHSPYYTSLFVACLFSTGNAVLLMALTRLFAVLFPLKHRAFFTSKVVNCLIVLSWITAILLGIGHRISFRDMGNFHLKYELFLSFLSFFQLVAILSFYVMIFKSAKQAHNVFKKGSFKISWTTYVIVLLCYATFLPYTVYRFVSNSDKSLTNNQKRETWRWIIAFSFLNSCVNPFLYLITTAKFKQELRCFGNSTNGQSLGSTRIVDEHTKIVEERV